MTELPQPSSAIQRGVATLYEAFGPDASFLLDRVTARDGEEASFDVVLPADFLGVSRVLRIGFPAHFPFNGLLIRIDPSPWLLWPHAMKDGVCLFGMRQRPASGTPEEIVFETVSRIRGLFDLVVSGSDPGARIQEFNTEITFYWNSQMRLACHQLVLIRMPLVARPLYALTDTRSRIGTAIQTTFLADDTKLLSRHWERVAGLRQPVRSAATAGFLSPIASTPPIEVPTPANLISWLTPHVYGDDLEALKTWHQETAGLPMRWLVLHLPGTEPPMLQAFALRGRGMRADGQMTYGRRTGRRVMHPPATRPPEALESALIQSLDRETIHSRDPGAAKVTLATMHVVLVGVGTLGSAIAAQLVRAGVGRLTLIDPDILMDANVGRHVLGADDLGRLKTEGLRDRLQREVPTADVVSVPTNVQLSLLTNRQAFDSADLIIVSTADWPSELALWEVKAVGAKWGLLQAWSEPYAEIGHVLLTPAGAYDASDLFETNGQFRHRHSTWPEDGIRPLPGCGASYIPGGPVGLSFIVSMTTQAALRFLTTNIEEPEWLTSIGNPVAIAAHGGTYIGPSMASGTSHMVLTRPWPDAERPSR